MALGAGLMLGVASTLSLGPNNLMLLREGLRRGRAATLATAVWGSEGVLLLLAYATADVIGTVSPLVRSGLLWFGLLALAIFAARSLWTACSAAAESLPGVSRESPSECVRRALLVVWFNPLSYLELLMVPSAICASFAENSSRLTFVATVLALMAVCNFGYAHGGRLLASVFRSRRIVRAFDLAAGLLMAGTAVAMGYRLVALP